MFSSAALAPLAIRPRAAGATSSCWKSFILGSHTKRKVPARHASGLTLWARNHGVGKSKPRVVYVSVKTIHKQCGPTSGTVQTTYPGMTNTPSSTTGARTTSGSHLFDPTKRAQETINPPQMCCCTHKHFTNKREAPREKQKDAIQNQHEILHKAKYQSDQSPKQCTKTKSDSISIRSHYDKNSLLTQIIIHSRWVKTLAQAESLKNNIICLNSISWYHISCFTPLYNV